METDVNSLLAIVVGVTGAFFVYSRLIGATGIEPDIHGEEGVARQSNASMITGIVDFSASLFPVLFVVFFVRSFLFEPFQIPSGSMRPTLEVGDYILVSKFAFGVRLPVLGTRFLPSSEPRRGDVVVFRYPMDSNLIYVKRIVGIPGDTIEYRDNLLFLNGEIVPTSLTNDAYIDPETGNTLLQFEERLGEVTHTIYKQASPPQEAIGNGSWVVPAGQYFAMGDNRNNSNDSRFWGLVPEDMLVGKAIAVFMHWPSVVSAPSVVNARLIN